MACNFCCTLYALWRLQARSARRGNPSGFFMPSRYPRAKTAERGYGARWQRYRKHYLADHPLCVYCKRQGRLTPATVVDHIVPHKGDQALFWNASNHQALCKQHHDSAKAAEEARGHSSEVGADGWPVDPGHPAKVTRCV